MTSSRALGYVTMAVVTAVAATWWLLPYFIGAPLALIVPGVVLAFCVFVAALEGPTRNRTRARLERDATLQVATWDYSAAAWPEVVRTAPSPGRRITLGITVLSVTADGAWRTASSSRANTRTTWTAWWPPTPSLPRRTAWTRT